MTYQGCLVIDDIEPSLACATEFGRIVLSKSAEEVCSVVLGHARRRGWTVISHSSYVNWANEARHQHDGQWLVLDPLFPVPDGDRSLRVVHLSRHSYSGQSSISGSLNEKLCVGIRVGAIDDAASSGRTLRYLARLVAQSGGSLAQIIVGASSREARDGVSSAHRDVRWTDLVPGDWRVIHLRDACPHLPHSGRPIGQPSIQGLDHQPIELRVQPTIVDGSLWQVMWLDGAIREAILSARANVARQLSAALGRPALVTDLGLLGARVPALVDQGQRVSADSTLESLLPARVDHDAR
jgi:hypothetical protein